ncbi:DUF3885 domain-containing protein [Actinomycetes bacterium NPDC127524]
MHEAFPDLELKPPLFYSWDISIRFELGAEWKREYSYPNSPYVLGYYKRVIALFEALHSSDDDIFVIMDVNDCDKGKYGKRKFSNFSPYVEKPLLYKLKHEIMPYLYPEDDQEGIYRTHRFSLKCKTAELTYKPLLKAICNQDLGLKPMMSHSVYFINIHKKTIFHAYDDRGCDVLAASPDTIRGMYELYNDWILDYDRPRIDKVFN